jgi:3-oxoacyl-[acyl-carrier-protein] synthase II
MQEREVVITGIGLISPIGKSVDENWAKVRDMKSGIAHYPKEGLPDFMQYAGRAEHSELPDDIPPKQLGQMKFLNRGALFGFSATCEAISRRGEAIRDTAPGRRALYVAAGDFTMLGNEHMYPAIKDSTDKKWESIDQIRLNDSVLHKVNPFFLLESLNNNLFSFLSAYVEFMGPNTSLASLSPCGANALELAYRSIKQDTADVALAVGYGTWINDIALYELEGLGILSRCKAGASSFRPFDAKRDGFIPGEGGAAILLEAADRAVKSGTGVLGKVKSVANCTEFSERGKLTVPDKVSRRNIMLAMEQADCSFHDLSLIIPHGSGTKKGDRSELRSIADVLGENRPDVPLSGLKPYTGHMGAASDIAEIIFGIHAVKDGQVPATLNFQETEKEFRGLNISGSGQPCNRQHFISTSYGVGGQSSSVVVEVT